MSAAAFRIAYLADHPQYTEACAAWCFGRWAVQSLEGSFAKTLSRFQQGMQKDELPLTLIALNNDNNLPIGMGSLWNKDGEEWQNFSPWIAALFVHYRYRKQGVASALVRQLEIEAQRLGYKELYLKTGSAAPVYRTLDYTEVETIPSGITAAGQLVLFKKDLT